MARHLAKGWHNQFAIDDGADGSDVANAGQGDAPSGGVPPPSIIPDWGTPPGPVNVFSDIQFTGEYDLGSKQYLYATSADLLISGDTLKNNGVIWSAPVIGNLFGAVLAVAASDLENTGKIVLDLENNGYQHAIAVTTMHLVNSGQIFAITNQAGPALALDFEGDAADNSGLLAAKATSSIAETVFMTDQGMYSDGIGSTLHNESSGKMLAEGQIAVGAYVLNGIIIIYGSWDPDDLVPAIVNDGLIQANGLDHSYASIGIETAHFDIDAVKIVNSGTIKADVAIYGNDYDAAASSETQRPIDVVYNEKGGLIVGEIDLERGDDVLHNMGTIQGNVYLGEGNDTFDNRGGVLKGIADLGWGDDMFQGASGVDLIAGNDGNDHIEGNAGADLLMGGGNDDTLIGGADNDGLFGEYGNDTIVTQAGDYASGGAGNDTVELGDYTFKYVSGDDGFDTLVLAPGARIIDLSMVASSGRVSGFEEIALNGNKEIAIHVGDIATITGGGSELRIDGESSDGVYLIGSWTYDGLVTRDGVSYREYSQSGHTVLVDDGATITVQSGNLSGATGLDPVAGGTPAPMPGSGSGLGYTPTSVYLVDYQLTQSITVNPEETWWNDAGAPVLEIWQTGITITNYGTIKSIFHTNQVENIALWGHNLEGLINYGTVEVVADWNGDEGVNAAANSGNYFDFSTNYGLIEAQSAHGTSVGIYSAAFTNAGQIIVESDNGDCIGASVSSIDNSGTIQATGATGAIGAWVALATISNTGDIVAHTTVSGESMGIAYVGNGDLTFTNAGTIEADIAISMGGGLQGPDLALNLDNTGTLIGRIDCLNISDNIVNSGTIQGNVMLGGGDDVYNGTGGKLVGTVFGGDGNDTLTGGNGDDRFDGGTGNDTISGGAGNDTASYTDATGAVSVNLTISGSQNVGGGAGSDTLISIENLEGSNFDDTLRGNAGDNLISGLAGKDKLDLSDGGNDTALGGDGNDTVLMGAALTAADSIDGGVGIDTVVLKGDYAAGVVFSKTTMVNVESIVLTLGFSYKLTTNDATVAAGQTLTVDASQLGAANFLNFDGSAETNGTFVVFGGAGNDIVKGGAGADTFTMTAGGDDTVAGGDGDDTFDFGGAFTAKDRIDGAKGSDTVLLNGDYSTGLVFQAATMINVESLILGKGHSYNLTTDDATVAAGQKLTVDGSQLQSGDVLIFNGSAEKDGSFVLIGGQGNDTLTGGGGADVFDLSHGGNDTAKGGGGTDTFQMGAALTAADKIDGGDGKDTVVLDGDYSLGLTFGATTMVNVETLRLTNGHGYELTMSDGNVAAGQTLTIDASKLGGGFALIFDGSAEHDGAFVVKGGRGNDHIVGGDGADQLSGGKGNDVLQGGNGADLLNGARGHDVFAYTAVGQSTGPVFDTITGFSVKQDKIDVWFSVTGVDTAVAHGALSLANFDSDLAVALGAAHLAGNHAVVFTPDSGDFAGDTFLVVDANGVAGYQAGQDLVIELDHAAHLSQLKVADFI